MNIKKSILNCLSCRSLCLNLKKLNTNCCFPLLPTQVHNCLLYSSQSKAALIRQSFVAGTTAAGNERHETRAKIISVSFCCCDVNSWIGRVKSNSKIIKKFFLVSCYLSREISRKKLDEVTKKRQQTSSENHNSKLWSHNDDFCWTASVPMVEGRKRCEKVLVAEQRFASTKAT